MSRAVFHVFIIILSTVFMSACGSSGDSNSSEGRQGTVFNVATRPLLDNNNTHPNFRTREGECLVDSCNSSANAVISQFKQDTAFVGFPYGLRGGTRTSIDVDSTVVEDMSTYSGPMATYTAKHSPVAVEQGNYTYFVFTGPATIDNTDRVATTNSGGNSTTTSLFRRTFDNSSNAVGVYLSRFNHVSNKVSQPILLHLKHTDDPHDNAVLNFDQNGDLFVLVAGRSLRRGAIMFYIANPNAQTIFDAELMDIRDISPNSVNYSNLGDLDIVTPDTSPTTYPKLIRINDGFRLIYTVYCSKNRGQQCSFGTRQVWSAKVSYDAAGNNNATLSEIRPLAAFGGHYAMAVGSKSGEDIAIAFNVTINNQPSERTNLYILYSNDFGNTWRYVDRRNGQRLSAESLLPVSTERELNQIAALQLENYDNSIRQRVYLKDIQLQGQGDDLAPQILVLRSEGSHEPVITNSHFLTLVRPSSNGWESRLLTTDIDHNYSTGFISQGLNDRIFFPATPESLNNGLAGGAPAFIDLPNDSGVNYVTQLRAPRTNNYLTNLCEMNYLRSTLFASGNSFVGIASASNPYQFEADSSNQYIPASPLYIINQDGSLLRLPMLIDDVDENNEMPVNNVPTGTELSCDSSLL